MFKSFPVYKSIERRPLPVKYYRLWLVVNPHIEFVSRVPEHTAWSPQDYEKQELSFVDLYWLGIPERRSTSS